MNSNENIIGKVLISVGGGLLIGKIISELSDDGSTRETRSSQRRTSKQKLSTRKFIVETIPPKHVDVSRSGDSLRDRKYPDDYYSLSKQKQYNYRKRISKEIQEDHPE